MARAEKVEAPGSSARVGYQAVSAARPAAVGPPLSGPPPPPRALAPGVKTTLASGYAAYRPGLPPVQAPAPALAPGPGAIPPRSPTTPRTIQWSDAEEAGEIPFAAELRGSGLLENDLDRTDYPIDQESKDANPLCVSPRYLNTGLELGRGAFGTVYRMCDTADRKSCAIAEKSQKYNDSFVREVYFLHQLQPLRLDGTHIVPRLAYAWECGGTTGKLDLDLWSGDVQTLGARQLTQASRYGYRVPTDAKTLYTRAQLDRMVRLAQVLTALHIVHGDVKPDNFLYRANADGSVDAKNIVVSDFGLAGDKWHPHPRASGKYAPIMGWTGYGEYECPVGDMVTTGFLADPVVRDYLNLWQLSEGLRDRKAAILDVNGRVTMFDGLVLPSELYERLLDQCGNYVVESRYDLQSSLGIP